MDHDYDDDMMWMEECPLAPLEDDGMDGDFDSGMASAGHGTDEDYGLYGLDADYD